MNANLSRSDILRPLAWLVGIVATMFLGSLFAKPPIWILQMDAIFLCLALGLYGFTYIYCLFNDRDALRSERYSLQKLAIEQGLYGDDRTGLIDETAHVVEEQPLIDRSQTRALEGR